jgi:membrane-bound ClpP family serine protease
MSVVAISLLILLGVLLILIEMLIIPGITVAGIAGVILIAGSIFLGYKYHGVSTGNYILLSTGVSLMLLIVLALKLKTWRRFGLNTTIDSSVGKIDTESIRAGDEGITVSRLAPIGKARIGDKLYEVRSDGGYVDAHSNIVITRISDNKIFVESKN